MDEIRIDNLEIYAYHGVYPEEKEKGQPFFLNVVLYLDTRAAGLMDELEATVDYGSVCRKLDQWMKEENCDLLERVAEKLAEKLMQEFPLIQKLDFEIRKPKAKIGLPFESVSVKIHRGWHRVYLSIGSNMGERERHLLSALGALKDCRQIRGIQVSSVIQTKPYGGVSQPDFLNAAIFMETLFSPMDLLHKLHQIESAEGRARDVRWGPRTLDLDILFYDKLVYEDRNLVIPHADLQNREFVLRPMCELAPYLRHPILGKTMEQLLLEIINQKI